MYLPPELDERIRTRFDTLIPEIDQLAKEVDESSSRNASERQNWESDRYRRGSGPMPEPLDETRFQRLHTNALSLLTSVSSNACSKQLRVAIEDIQRMSGAHNGPSLLAIMQGVYDDYLAGMLDCREQSIKPDDSIEGEEQGLDWRLLFSILASLVLAVVIIGIANTLDWEWYSEHPDFYKLQGAVFAFVFLLSLGFLYPKGRRWAWVGGGIVAAASLIIESLGGKT